MDDGSSATQVPPRRAELVRGSLHLCRELRDSFKERHRRSLPEHLQRCCLKGLQRCSKAALNWFDPRTAVVCATSKVTAPSRRQLEAQELTDTLRDGKINLPRVDSFCTEVDVDAQRIFAVVLGTPEEDLCRTARDLAEHTSEKLPLPATWWRWRVSMASVLGRVRPFHPDPKRG